MPDTASVPGSRRVAAPALEGLRGLAAQVVLAGHAAAILWPDLDPTVLAFLGWLARLAVLVFFVLSGFVIALSLDGGFQAGTYALHRIARIAPPYLLSVALVGLVAAVFQSGAVPRPAALAEAGLRTDAGAWLRAASLTYRTNDPHNLLNGPIWSLRLEVALYVVAGCLALAAGRARPMAIRSGSLVLAGAIAALMTLRLSFGALALALFGSGALTAVLSRRGVALRAPGWLATALALAVLALPAYHLWADALLASDAVGFAGVVQAGIGLAVCAGILDLAHRESAVSRFLGAAAALGRFAYTLYVLHVPLLFLAAGVGVAAGSPRLLTLLAAVMTIEGGCWLAARAVERPRRFRHAIGRLLPASRRPS